MSMIQALEPRRLLSTVVENRILYAEADNGVNDVTLEIDDVDTTRLIITIDGDSTPFGIANLDGVRIYTKQGSDTITISNKFSTLSIYVSSGQGDDTVVGGNGAETLLGGPGDDSLTGAGGRDSLGGADGADTLEGDAGVDTLNGGDDVDDLYGGDGKDAIRGGLGTDDFHTDVDDEDEFLDFGLV